MEKEEITVLAQLLTGMKDAVEKLEEFQDKKDQEKIKLAKNEILNLQKEIDKIL